MLKLKTKTKIPTKVKQKKSKILKRTKQCCGESGNTVYSKSESQDRTERGRGKGGSGDNRRRYTRNVLNLMKTVSV